VKNDDLIKSAHQHLLKNDKVLSRIIKKNSNCNLHPKRQYFQALLTNIIGQQLSVQSASAIIARFYNHFGKNVSTSQIVNAPNETLRSLGLSNAKAKYVKRLAESIENKTISLKNIRKKTNSEIEAELTQVKGIGIWTVHMFLIFTLGRHDVLPFSDLGIKKAIMLNYGLLNMPSEVEVKELAGKMKWSPYESIASWYLWKSLEYIATNFEN